MKVHVLVKIQINVVQALEVFLYLLIFFCPDQTQNYKQAEIWYAHSLRPYYQRFYIFSEKCSRVLLALEQLPCHVDYFIVDEDDFRRHERESDGTADSVGFYIILIFIIIGVGSYLIYKCRKQQR